MIRQVVRGEEFRGASKRDQGDAYTERLLKLVPSETVALYLFLDGILKSAMATPEQLASLKAWLWGITAAVVLLNILYLRRFQLVTDFWQYVIQTIGLLIWIMTIGGPFVYLTFYEPFMGSVALGLFTFAVPIFYTGVPVDMPPQAPPKTAGMPS
jgi:hypothetical protein